MIKIGIIGTGGMANAQARQFQTIKGVTLAACCDVDLKRARAFAATHHIPRVYTDYRALLDEVELDGVSNVTPDAMHCPISLAVIRRGLGIMCEKPLATSLADARKMAAAARQAGVPNIVNFSYRNSAALQAAAKLVAAGGLGELRHVEASYLQSWLVSRAWGDWRKAPAFTWRLSTRHGSLGDLGDVGVHILDAVSFLCGEIDELACQLECFDKGVPRQRLGKYVLDANDSFVATVRFAGGALGTVHSTRWATGQANSIRLRAFGTAGGLEIDLDRSYTEYRLCRGRKNIDANQWQTVKCPPTPSQYQRFVTALRTGRNDAACFATGAKVQAYLAACFESDHLGRPVKVRR